MIYLDERMARRRRALANGAEWEGAGWTRRLIRDASREPERDEPISYVIHLPVMVDTEDAAVALACALVNSLDFMPEVDGGETSVSPEDAQNNRRRVFCNRLIEGRRGGRCPQRHGHSGSC